MGQRVNSARLVGAFEREWPIIPKHLRVKRPKWKMPKWQRVDAFVRERDNYTCQGCGWVNPFPYPAFGNRQMVLDHIIPLCRGGTNEISNFQLLCEPCNTRKGSRVYDFTAGGV